AAQSGEVVLGGVDTNATQVTANLANDLGETWHFDVPFSFDVPIDGDVAVGGDLTVQGDATIPAIAGREVVADQDYRLLTLIGGVEQIEGRRSWYSHSVENGWMAQFRVEERTFCWEGVVPGNPYAVNNDITTATSELLDRYYFSQMPQNCYVIFHFDVVTVISDGLEVSNVVDYGSRRMQQLARRIDGGWSVGSGGNHTDDIVAVNGAQVLIWPKTGNAEQLVMRATFDPSAQGYDYRIGARISARVIEMDPD